MRYKLLTTFAVFFCVSVVAQTSANDPLKRPKLVVGIVVDQMRWDYLYKFYSLYSESGGFKRMLNNGFSCDNAFIPYTPTVTAAGHTSVYTGSVPAIDGIVGNVWYEKLKNKVVYCADDDSVKTIGAADNAGKMSPRNLVVTTITDELRLATNFSSKVVGLSIKDRGAIFPAGHVANAAYWYDPSVGNFITSSYYMDQLPAWVNNFNERKLPDSLYNLNWNLSLPEKVYLQHCGADEQLYERKPFGTDQKHFPYILSSFAKKDYSKISTTPHGNTLLENMAEAAIVSENLGRNVSTDFLAISFSSPDYIGHTFGPESWEQLDDYVKLDSTLGKLLSFLDKQVGNGNYLVFLTADHAVVNSPGFSVQHHLPGGTFNDDSFANQLKQSLFAKYKSQRIIKGYYEDQLLLNYAAIDSLRLNRGPGRGFNY
jgi:predicted AlkP superfamily pyrophosphatase or phosphodiesterase